MTSKQQLYERIERLEGPALIGYWIEHEAASEYRKGTQTYGWHQHLRGQFSASRADWCMCIRSMAHGFCRRIAPVGYRLANRIRSASASR